MTPSVKIPARIQQKTNRLNARRNRITYQEKRRVLSQRKQRTRTLIQLGGLIHKSGLMQKINLDMGDDLQDPKHILKAAQIFGFLIKSLECVSCDLKAWQAIGEQHLKRKTLL